MTASRSTPARRGLRGPSSVMGQWHRLIGEYPTVRAVTRVLVLLAAFIVVDHLVMRMGKLSEASYAQPVLAIELIRHTSWVLWLGILASIVTLATAGNLAAPWRSFSGGRGLRVFVVAVAFILVWPFASAGYNYYLGQGHIIDRLLLIAMLVALWWRALFVLPLLCMLAVMLWQLVVPQLGGSVLAHKLFVFDVLCLFAATVIVQGLTKTHWCKEFVFLCCCLVAGAYVTAAFAKIGLGWWGHAQLYLMPISAYGHGWLAFLTPEQVGQIAQWLKPWDVFMQTLVLVVEAGCLVFLWRRAVSMSLLIALAVFHFGVFALYGFLFWTWIALDMALLALLWVRNDVLGELQIGITGFLLSVVLIGTSFYWSKPPWLAWFDTGLSYNYRLEAVTASGARYPLHPDYFAPYSDAFTMTSFSYLSQQHRILTGPYGVTKNRNVAERIAAASSAQEVLALEEELGRDLFDRARAKRFAEFVSRFVATRHALSLPPFDLTWLAPPNQFISQRIGVSDTEDVRIEAIVVNEVTTWFDGHRPQEIRTTEVAHVLPTFESE